MRYETVEGSGVAAAEVRDVPAFTAVELAGSNDVAIAVGGQQSVVVKADDNLLERVTTEVWNRTLEIGNTPGTYLDDAPMRVEVTVPSLDGLALTGSGVMSVSGLAAPSLEVTLSGSGVVRASGTASRLDVTVDGSGQADLGDVVVRDVRARVNGAGRVVVTATESLDASVPGTGAIVYEGDPPQVRARPTATRSVTPARNL